MKGIEALVVVLAIFAAWWQPGWASPPVDTLVNSDSTDSLSIYLLSKLSDIDKELGEIRSLVEPEPFIKEIGEQFLINGLWELIGFQRRSGGALSRVVNLIGFLFLVVRIMFFIGDRLRRGGQTTTQGGRFRFIISAGAVTYVGAVVLAILLWNFLPRSPSASSENLANLDRAVNKLEALIEKAENTEFNEVVSRLDSLMGQLRSGKPEAAGASIDEIRGVLIEQAKAIKSDFDEAATRTAGRRAQGFQTFLLLLIGIGVVVILIGTLRKGWWTTAG